MMEVDSKAEVGVGFSPGKEWCTNTPFSIQGEMAMVGMRTPN